VVIFSPNGVVPKTFWPDEEGDKFTFKESLQPLEPLRDRSLILHACATRFAATATNHMRGIGCLLTGIELFPGNIQGGSDTPAGWGQRLVDRPGKSSATCKRRTPRGPASARWNSAYWCPSGPTPGRAWSYDGPNKRSLR